MPCIESSVPGVAGRVVGLVVAVMAAGCAVWPTEAPPAAAAPAQTPAPSAPPTAAPIATPSPPAQAPATTVTPAVTAPVRLPPPVASRTWEEFKVQAARRMVAASPDVSHTGKVQEPLLAIPVLEVDVNADGSVRRIQVLRRPVQAPETVQVAIDAVQRGSPYGDMTRLPRPWRFTEAFLFNDDRRFKPRTLDP